MCCLPNIDIVGTSFWFMSVMAGSPPEKSLCMTFFRTEMQIPVFVIRRFLPPETVCWTAVSWKGCSVFLALFVQFSGCWYYPPCSVSSGCCFRSFSPAHLASRRKYTIPALFLQAARLCRHKHRYVMVQMPPQTVRIHLTDLYNSLSPLVAFLCGNLIALAHMQLFLLQHVDCVRELSEA